MNLVAIFVTVGLLWLICGAVLATGFAIAARARRQQCLMCLGHDVEEDDYGRCHCLECHHRWTPLKRFGSGSADM